MSAAWVRCPFCDEFWCVVHKMHAFECPCPPVEEWEVDPYGAGGLDYAARFRDSAVSPTGAARRSSRTVAGHTGGDVR